MLLLSGFLCEANSISTHVWIHSDRSGRKRRIHAMYSSWFRITGGLIWGRHDSKHHYWNHVTIFLTVIFPKAGDIAMLSMSSYNLKQNKLQNKSSIFRIFKEQMLGSAIAMCAYSVNLGIPCIGLPLTSYWQAYRKSLEIAAAYWPITECFKTQFKF